MKLFNSCKSKKEIAKSLLFAVMLFLANNAFATDYFIDSVSGNNTNSGLTLNSPWKDLSFINSKTILPGSNIYLKCGSVWNGQQLKFSGSGTNTSPIQIDKYGIGPAPILNGNGLIGEGVVYLFNQQYIEINNLEITNAPNGALDSDFFVGTNNGTINNNPLGADRRGVMVVIDDYGVANHIYLKNLNIHHIKGQLGNSSTAVNGAIPKRTGGVYFAVLNEASTSNSRFNDVLIDGCSVNYCENIGIAFDNEDNVYYPGGTEYATWYARRFSNVKISNNTIHHIGKNAMIIRYTDETGLIERNVCYETALGTTGNTMMTTRAKGTVFQYNEGYFNRGTTQTVDPGTVDGSMYDPDYGSIGIIFQYSYSHDNSEGLYWGCNTRGLANNTSGIPDPEDVGCTLRYNISQNDMGDLIFFNYPSAGNEIYNNVFYLKSGTNANIIHESSTKNHTYNFYNNIIYNLSTKAKYAFGSGTGIQTRIIENNIFYGINPSTEPSDINKLITDPLFVAPGLGGLGLSSLGGYRLQENSPAISSGKIIANNGGYDFYNTTISTTKNPNRGVFEGTEKPVAANQIFCGTANPTVANLVATGTALKWYSASTGGNALATTTPLSTEIYYLSQTLNAFESERIPVSITVNVTAAPTANAQTFCNSGTVANLVATGTALQWYSVATDGTALVSTSALASGTYYVSQTLNACEGPRTAVNITVNITAAPKANTQTFCNSGTVANLVATGTDLQWYLASTGGTALASTVALASGTYYVTQTLNGCEGPRTSVAVTVNITAAPTANAQTFCNSATVANLVATGIALQWYSVSSGGTVLASTTALASGIYYVSQTLNTCEGPRTAVNVTVNVTAAPTANEQTFCNSATVANLVATGSALKWYSLLTDGTVLASTAALASGTYYVSQTVNACEGLRTAVNVTVNVTATPTANAQTFCNSATVANIVATGTALKWYSVSAGGTALASTVALASGTYYVSQTLNSCEGPRTSVAVTINTTAAPTSNAQTFCNSATMSNLVATGTALQWYSVATVGTALASTIALASGTYYVSQTLNSCEGPRTAVNITVNVTAAPIANAQSFCNSATVANLVATGSALKWYSVVTGGTALASTLALASATYYVSQTLNNCEGPRTSVAVTINTTAAPTASAQTFCNSATVSNLVANGTTLKWYSVSAGGTALASTLALASGTYYVSQTLNNCEGPRTSVAVTINTTAAPTANAQTFCNSATLSNLVATGTALKWYSIATGGTALASTTALATATYYVSQTVNGCEGPRKSIAVTVNVTLVPTANAQTFCASSNPKVSNLVATGTAIKWYSAATGGTALASTTSLVSGTYYVSQTLNSCESTRKAVAVSLSAAAKVTSIIGSNTSTTAVCTNTILTLSYAAGAVGTPQWMMSETLNGTYSNILGATNPTYNYLPTLAKIVYFKVKMTNAPCTTSATSAAGVPVHSKICAVARIMLQKTKPFEVAAYPNPFNSSFKIKVTTSSTSSLEFKVYDMIGKLIEVVRLNLSEIDSKDFGENLAPGIYNVLGSQENNVEQLRLIKR